MGIRAVSPITPAFACAAVGVRVTFNGVEDRASGPVTLSPAGANERETYGSQWVGSVSVDLGAFVSKAASGPTEAVAFDKWDPAA